MPGASLGQIYDRLNGVAPYHPFEADTFADWSMEAGDIVTVSRGNESYQSPVHSTRMVWRGTPNIEVNSTGSKEREAIARISKQKYARGGGGFNQMQELYYEFFSEDGQLHSYILMTASALVTHFDNELSDVHSEIVQTAEMIYSTVYASQSQIYSYVDQTATYIESVVANTASGLGSAILQTQSMIHSAVWAANSEVFSYIDQTSTYILSVVESVESDLGSAILQTASQIRSEVHAAESSLYSYVDQTATYILSVVENTASDLGTSILQTASQIRSEAHAAESTLYSYVDQTATYINSVIEDTANELGSAILQTASQIRSEVHANDSALFSYVDQTATYIESVVQDTANSLGSAILQTASEIRSELHANDSTLFSYVDQTATYIESVVASTASSLGSAILQTASQIRSEVHAADSSIYSYVNQTASGIRQEVANTASGLQSSINQQANRISLVVEGTGSNTHIKPAAIQAGINAATGQSKIKLSADHIQLDGDVVANALTVDDPITVASVNAQAAKSYFYDFQFEDPMTGEGPYNSGEILVSAYVDNNNTLHIINAAGDETTFSKAASVTALTGSWSGGTLTVVTEPDSGHRFVNTPSLALNGNGTDSFSAEMSAVDSAGTTAVRSQIYGYLRTSGSTSSTVVNVCQNSDGTGVVGSLSVGSLYTSGQNSVNVVKGSWVGGRIAFTPSAGTGKTKTIELFQGTTTWNNSIASVPVKDGNLTAYTVSVDASTIYTSGQNSIRVTGSWDGNQFRFSKTTTGNKNSDYITVTPGFSSSSSGYYVHINSTNSSGTTTQITNGVVYYKLGLSGTTVQIQNTSGSRISNTPTLSIPLDNRTGVYKITSNNTYYPPTGYLGFSAVEVDVPTGGSIEMPTCQWTSIWEPEQQYELKSLKGDYVASDGIYWIREVVTCGNAAKGYRIRIDLADFTNASWSDGHRQGYAKGVVDGAASVVRRVAGSWSGNTYGYSVSTSTSDPSSDAITINPVFGSASGTYYIAFQETKSSTGQSSTITSGSVPYALAFNGTTVEMQRNGARIADTPSLVIPLQSRTGANKITSNNTYYPSFGYLGFSAVEVNVPSGSTITNARTRFGSASGNYYVESYDSTTGNSVPNSSTSYRLNCTSGGSVQITNTSGTRISNTPESTVWLSATSGSTNYQGLLDYNTYYAITFGGSTIATWKTQPRTEANAWLVAADTEVNHQGYLQYDQLYGVTLNGNVVATWRTQSKGSSSHDVSLSVNMKWTGSISGYTNKGSYSASELARTYIRISASCGGSTKKWYYTIN